MSGVPPRRLRERAPRMTAVALAGAAALGGSGCMTPRSFARSVDASLAQPPQESPPMAHPEPAPSATPRPANRLARETSPYLLQHAHNPVDWYPWGSEAFARAKQEDKPIFLSIGYSACHWCHVMEHECFENAEIAALMNASFVCVKVDREERPDVDEIYMKSVQLLTQSGGWPMSVWLTPDGKPFYGGTYFPPDDRYGRPGFPRVCKEMTRLWNEERARVTSAADALTGEIQKITKLPAAASDAELPAGLVDRAGARIVRGFDEVHGGFGAAPKFPHPMDLSLLLRADARAKPEGRPEARHAVQFTLEKMAAGGIYDQIGGGFHRYSTDEKWLVPHFEKMLYDNAQLADVYLDAWLATGDADHARIVREILDYVLREMTSPEGGFHSTQDADSEGVEGKFFTWTPEEIASAVGAPLSGWAAEWFGATAAGNFRDPHHDDAPPTNVLSRPRMIAEFAAARGMTPEEVAAGIAAAREKLFRERSKRIAPGRDDKVLADWNGLMIAAFARAGFHLDELRYVDAARKAAAFVRAKLWSDDGGGRLLRSWKDGQAKHVANLADYAFLADGFLDLYEAAFEPADLAFARRLVDVTLAKFWDEQDGGFWFTASDAEALIARSKDAYDGATPSGASVQVMNLLRLVELTGDENYRQKAMRTLALYRPILEQQPQAASRMLWAVDFLESKPREIVLAGESAAAVAPFLAVLRKGFDPNRVVLVATSATTPALEKLTTLVEGKGPIGGRPAAYVCRDGACKLPITDPLEFAKHLTAAD